MGACHLTGGFIQGECQRVSADSRRNLRSRWCHEASGSIAGSGSASSAGPDKLDGVAAGRADFPQPAIGFVRRAVAAIRTWLRQNVPGFAKLELSDAEIIRSYILPADMADEKLGDKFRTYIVDQMREALTEPTARARYIVTAGTSSGTVVGEVVRTLTQFKSFSATFMERHMGREFRRDGVNVPGVVLPLSALWTFLLMRWTGLSANLMSLGGLAIAIGMLVDAAVVVLPCTTRESGVVMTSGAHNVCSGPPMSGGSTMLASPVYFHVTPPSRDSARPIGVPCTHATPDRPGTLARRLV